MESTHNSCYAPLRKQNDDIRLLTIDRKTKNNSEELICCSLAVFSCENAPRYTALSYVWGSHRKQKDIVLNGVLKPVRANLFAFLQQYIASEREGYLWIDALCINQDDIKEQSHQVQLMGKIFSRANLTISWLGAGDPLGRQSQDIPTLEQAVIKLAKLCVLSTERMDKLYEFIDAEKMEIFYLLLEDKMRFMNEICKSTYWTRMWVIQEVVLSRNAEIWCGEGVIKFDSFRRIFQLLKLHAGRPRGQRVSRVRLVVTPGVRDIMMLKKQREDSVAMSSDVLFSMSSESHCANVRDRIYALLGLMDPKELLEFPIYPDYEISVSQLFLNLCERHVKKCGSQGSLGIRIVISLQHRLNLSPGDEIVKEAEAKFCFRPR